MDAFTLLLSNARKIKFAYKLVVSPANQLPFHVAPNASRILVNREDVKNYQFREDKDVTVLSEADIAFQRFADQLGWREELEFILNANQKRDV